jgi:hypothetical protein
MYSEIRGDRQSHTSWKTACRTRIKSVNRAAKLQSERLANHSRVRRRNSSISSAPLPESLAALPVILMRHKNPFQHGRAQLSSFQFTRERSARSGITPRQELEESNHPTRTPSGDDWLKARLCRVIFWSAASGDRPKNQRPTAMTPIAESSIPAPASRAIEFRPCADDSLYERRRVTWSRSLNSSANPICRRGTTSRRRKTLRSSGRTGKAASCR